MGNIETYREVVRPPLNVINEFYAFMVYVYMQIILNYSFVALQLYNTISIGTL